MNKHHIAKHAGHHFTYCKCDTIVFSQVQAPPRPARMNANTVTRPQEQYVNLRFFSNGTGKVMNPLFVSLHHAFLEYLQTQSQAVFLEYQREDLLNPGSSLR